MAESHDALAEALRDHYVLERELGRGGMATVYLARDLKHDRPVALKVLRPELASALGPERFLREIQLTARLQHPHVLPVFDSGQSGGALWYAMPYVEGETLRARLIREGTIPVAEAVRLTGEIADALEYAHRHGIVHRDIKPENILLSQGHALVADFGIAKPPTGDGTTALTETGLVVGTAAYMSPEQASGHPVTPASDLYSLGCVVYEMLAGEPPFLSPTAQGMLARRFSERPPSVRACRRDVPATIDAAIARVLARSPDERYRSAVAFAEALALPAKGKRVVAWRLAAGVVALLAVALLLLHRSSARSAVAAASRHATLVVLPPQNLGDTAGVAFADGLGDEITTRLASLDGLGIIGRASAARYRGSSAGPRQIARELGADYVLLTSIRWDRGRTRPRVRVTSELVRATDQTSAWSDTYEADLVDIFDVQGRVAARVAEAMGLRLGRAERERGAAVASRNPEALRHFLRGRDAMRQVYIGYKDLEEDAVRAFSEATRLDPGFAAAWAALAEALLGLDWATEARIQRADSAVHVALQLAPGLPEARAVLSRVLLARGLPDSAIAELERARQARPGSAEILRALGVAVRERAGLDSSLRVLAQAVRLDPRSAETLTDACTSAYAVNRDSAAAYCGRVVELEPDLFRGYLALAWKGHLDADQQRVDSVIAAYGNRVGLRTAVIAFAPMAQYGWLPSTYDSTWLNFSTHEVARHGLYLPRALVARRLGRSGAANADLDSAIAQVESVLRGRDTLATIQADWIEVQLGLLRGLRGDSRRAAEITRQLLRRNPASSNWYVRTQLRLVAAMTFTLTGDQDAAIDELENQLREPWLITRSRLRRDPFWDPLRGNPRFQRLVAGGS